MADDTTDDGLELGQVLDFAGERAADEVANVEHDVPNHADRILLSHLADLQQDLVSFEMSDDIDEDTQTDVLERRSVDIVLAVGALAYEHGLDVAAAVDDRIDLVEDVQDFREALEDADSDEERMDIIEAADDALLEELGVPTETEDAPTIGGSVEPGDNVDADDYEPDDDRDRHVQ